METNTTRIEQDASQTFEWNEAVAGSGRYDGYVGIHKAIRLCMCNTLTRIGSTDPADQEELRSTLNQVIELLNLCQSHIKHENEFIHPALERVRPGSARKIQMQHLEHGEGIDNLRDLVGLVADSRSEPRAATLTRLYRALAVFVADNFEHMHLEETDHNAVLWAHYSDAELLSIDRELVGSISPEEMVKALHWFMPALAAPERAEMLRGIQADMPPEPFLGILDIARRTVSTPDFAKLCRALGMPKALARVED